MYRKTILTIFMLLLISCQAATPPTPVPNQVATLVALTMIAPLTATPHATVTLHPTAASTIEPPSILGKTTTYQEESIGFALDYPETWTRMGVQTGERGSIVAIASWDISPQNMDSTPPGETRLDISVLQWEPLDLDSYVNQRKIAWEASGITILSEERRILQNGLSVIEFRVAGGDGKEAYFLVALISDRFITLSGTGDFVIMAQIGDTLRITP